MGADQAASIWPAVYFAQALVAKDCVKRDGLATRRTIGHEQNTSRNAPTQTLLIARRPTIFSFDKSPTRKRTKRKTTAKRR